MGFCCIVHFGRGIFLFCFFVCFEVATHLAYLLFLQVHNLQIIVQFSLEKELYQSSVSSYGVFAEEKEQSCHRDFSRQGCFYIANSLK